MTINSFTRYSVQHANRMMGCNGWVYFALCPAIDMLKIGWSVDPGQRIVSLQPGVPFPVEMITARPGSKADEKALHLRYSDLRVSGEWFRYGPQLKSLVSRTLAKHGATPWPGQVRYTKDQWLLERAVRARRACYIHLDDGLAMMRRI